MHQVYQLPTWGLNNKIIPDSFYNLSCYLVTVLCSTNNFLADDPKVQCLIELNGLAV